MSQIRERVRRRLQTASGLVLLSVIHLYVWIAMVFRSFSSCARLVPPRYFCSFWLCSFSEGWKSVAAACRALAMCCVLSRRLPGLYLLFLPAFHILFAFSRLPFLSEKKFLGIHFKSLDRETKREKTAQGEKDADKEGSNKKSRERRVSRMHWSCSLGERCSSAKGYTPT